jgi:hypothetical protein
MTKTIQTFKAAADPGPSLRIATAIAGMFMAIGVAALLMLSACATVPQPPTEALQGAEQAIANAEQARVADYASPELGQAREKLTAARAAVQEEKMVLAQRLAEESRVDAELASAKAEAAKAKTVNDEMRKSTETLKQEMQRNPGAQ